MVFFAIILNYFQPLINVAKHFIFTSLIGILTTTIDNRIKSIIVKSKNREDTLHKTLQPLFDNDPDLKVKLYCNCESKHCVVKQKSQNQDPPSKERSIHLNFDLQKLCIYCGIDCSIIHDPRHTDQWREAYIILTFHYFCHNPNFLAHRLISKICVKNRMISG